MMALQLKHVDLNGRDSSEEIFEVSEDGLEKNLEDETMVDHHEFSINVEHIGQME